ncbi:MAG: glutamyl-tRNA reductase [Salinirussus sp.]
MTRATRTIAGLSVSHTDASVERLERAAAPSQREAVRRLLDAGAEEAYALQTCNRVEGYVVADTAETGQEILAELFGDLPAESVVRLDHTDSLRHLLRVAAGLESLIVGEDQILGQVRNAYEDARGAGGIGPMLEDGVTKAIRVGERARTETAINEGAVSIASAAVRLLADECSGLGSATGLVVGAGEMGTIAAKNLAELVAEVVVANRTVPHAEHVASEVAGEASAVGLDDLDAALTAADVVVTATDRSGTVIDPGGLAAAGETVVVDLGQPRDVAPGAAETPAVTVYDLDALEAVTEETRARRQEAAQRVERIVDEELDRLLAQYRRKRADRVISAMYESAERVKVAETNKALRRLDLDAEGEAVVEDMADALVSQLLAAPTNSLRDAAEEDDWSTINAALQLFDPDFGPDATEPPDFVKGMDPDEMPEAMREELPAAVLEQLDD